MRKWIRSAALVIFSVMMCLEGPDMAGAKNRAVTVPEFDIALELPEDWKCITRETEPDDPLFTEINADGESLLEFQKQNGVYIDAFTGDIELTLVWVGEREDVTQLGDISDAELNDLMAEMRKEEYDDVLDGLKEEMDIAAVGLENMVLVPTELYRNERIAFVISDTELVYPNISIYGYQYLTVINGQEFVFNFNSLTGERVTEGQKKMAREIIDTFTVGHYDEAVEQQQSLWPGILTGAAAGGLIGAVICGVYCLIKKFKRRS